MKRQLEHRVPFRSYGVSRVLGIQRQDDFSPQRLRLVNRLQSVATKLGDNAATAKDGGLPSLWDLLPSIVVIGGQVEKARLAHICSRKLRHSHCQI